MHDDAFPGAAPSTCPVGEGGQAGALGAFRTSAASWLKGAAQNSSSQRSSSSGTFFPFSLGFISLA